MNRKLIIIALALTMPEFAASQVPSAPDPIVQRIHTIAIDSSQTQRLAHQLFDSIGPRLTGSPDAKRGNDWLVRMYKSWGIDAKNEQYGTWRGWRRGYSHIDMVYPRTRSLEGTMLA